MTIDILGPDLRSSRPIALVRLRLLASPSGRSPCSLPEGIGTRNKDTNWYREAIMIALLYGARQNSRPIQLGVEHAVWI